MKKVIYILGGILSIAIVIAIIYITGAVASIEHRDVSFKQHIQEYMNKEVEIQDYIIHTDQLVKKLKSPLKVAAQIRYVDYRLLIGELIVVIFILAKIWIYIAIFSDYMLMYLQMGGIVLDKKKTFGDAKFISIDEFKKYIKKRLLALHDGIVLGSLNNPNEGKIRNFRRQLITIPENRRFNKHIFVNASSGDGKSTSFVLTSVINLVKSVFKYKPSFLFTDPKGELYELLSGFLKKVKGYTVYLFNLVSMNNSDRFNVLDFIETQVDVKVIVDTILQNTRVDASVKGTSDPFWDEAEKSIIQALVLYYKFYLKEFINMAMLFDLINNSTYEEIDKIFIDIPNTESCKQMFNIYNKAPKELKGNILLGLCSRLSIFTMPEVRRLTEKTDINIYDLKDKHTAIFAVIPDTHDSFNFLAALFETMIGIKVVEYTDRNKRNKMIKNREIYAFLDEIANVGKIPGFEKWITTFRSRNFHLIPIFQDVIQPKKLFGDSWLTIYGNCHTKICLGAGDPETAKFYTEQMGIQSIKVTTKTKDAGVFKMLKNKRWSQTDDKTNLMNADQLLTMDMDELIVMRRSCKPMRLYKFLWENYKEEYEQIEELSETIYEYTPEWSLMEAIYTGKIEVTENENKTNTMGENNAETEEEIFYINQGNDKGESNNVESQLDKVNVLENGSNLL
ncbi:type IV secretory system conjugative DNA transfer family protein (plasmid) [Vallitalea pronyensis]|uniref:Type IV secretory system conjugative DNA transfer family protein n=1 Tax=Vallitalea pronyensis TaxID=1348613 RepID=A0A8J8SJR2_9FIRM|nr:type IV secretory system conjugative DNA transfer family protein [Vallitalea pronyensis]QUI25886.1 type IV secretory system conjugative DNA transfer family protein [Vallitalea pronyensis]